MLSISDLQHDNSRLSMFRKARDGVFVADFYHTFASVEVEVMERSDGLFGVSLSFESDEGYYSVEFAAPSIEALRLLISTLET